MPFDPDLWPGRGHSHGHGRGHDHGPGRGHEYAVACLRTCRALGSAAVGPRACVIVCCAFASGGIDYPLYQRSARAAAAAAQRAGSYGVVLGCGTRV